MRFSRLLAGLAAGLAVAAAPDPEPLQAMDWSLLDAFLAKLVSLFPAKIAVDAACNLIRDADDVVSDFFGIPHFENDPCGDVTFIFVRGTCEPANIGGMVGPWIAKSIQEHIGSKTLGVKGLEYPAAVVDYLNGSKPNGLLLAKMIKNTLAECPSTKLVLGGYSQGAMVVHEGAANLDAATMSQVKAVVLFGDPHSHKPVANIAANKVKVYCNKGDNICDDGPFVTLPHLTYAIFAADAGAFVGPLVG